MAITNGFITEAEYRAWSGDATAGTTSVIEEAIESASDWIREHCGRRFFQEAATSTRTYKCDDAEVMTVADISTTTGLVIKTDTSGDYSWSTTWDSTDYDLEPANAEVVGSGSTAPPHAWWRIVAIDDKAFPVSTRRRTLQVTARFGWSGIPDNVKQACKLLSSRIMHRAGSPHGIAGTSEFGAVRITRNDADVLNLLAPYIKLHGRAV